MISDTVRKFSTSSTSSIPSFNTEPPERQTVASPVSAPAVPITDGDLIERLNSNPHTPVQCTLPQQLELLQRIGWKIQHLELTLDGSQLKNLNELSEAAYQGLAGCKALTALSLQVNARSAQVTLLNWVCCAVIEKQLPLRSLTVCLAGEVEPTASRGVQKLLSLHPDMALHGQGPSASITLLKSLPAGAAKTQLTLSGVDGHAKALCECLSKLGPSTLSLDIELGDENTDAFMQCLLEADVSNKLQISLHSPQGRTVTWQERLDALQGLALDKLLEECTQDRTLDAAALLQRCKALGSAGPMTFVMACQAAAAAGLRGASAEVPIAEASYLRALSNSDVPHVAVCVLPQDVLALESCKGKKVQALRIDLGDIQANNDLSVTVAVLGMRNLKHLTVQGRNLRPGAHLPFFGNAKWSLDTLCLDIQGPATWESDGSFAKFLQDRPLQKLICKGSFASFRLLTVAGQMGHRDTPLSVELAMPYDARLPSCLNGLRAQWMHLSIRITEEFDLQPLKGILAEQHKESWTKLMVGGLRLSSLSQVLPATDPLLLAMAKDQIDEVVARCKHAEWTKKRQEAEQAVAARNQERQERAQQGGAAEPFERLDLQALNQQANYFKPLGVMKGFQASSNMQVFDMTHPLEEVAKHWLDRETFVQLSSTSSAARANTGYEEQSAQWVMPWVLQQQAAGRPEDECRAVLQALYGAAFADLVIAKARQAQH